MHFLQSHQVLNLHTYMDKESSIEKGVYWQTGVKKKHNVSIGQKIKIIKQPVITQ